MFWMYPLIPIIPDDYDLPPTLYSILNSIVNFDKETKVKIDKLAASGKNKIFDFNYPLTNKINKEDFETLILNKFMMRRIGYETVTSFKLALNVKLNEIMPFYNKLFDSLDGWDLFKDGEKVIRHVKDNTTDNTINDSINNTSITFINNSNSKTNSQNNDISNSNSTINNTGETSDITDLRSSDTPQNQIEDVKNGKYITNYNYNTSNGTLSNNTDSSNNSESTSTNETITTDKNEQNTENINTINSNTNNTRQNNINEIITRTPSDKISIYKEFLNTKNSIYNMIFNDLDELFFQLV